MLTATVFFIIGVILLLGWRKIPADPPHKGARTLFGKRTGKFVDEGWRYFWLYPIVQGYIPVNVERGSFTVISENTLTPDNAQSKVPVEIVYRPHPKHYIEYLNSGGAEAVEEQLTGQIQQKIREWAVGDERGPATWKELAKAQEEASSVLIRNIVGVKRNENDESGLTPMPPYAHLVPTWIWLRFYLSPKPKVLLTNENRWGNNNWEMVRAALTDIETTHGLEAV
ncbi:MAG: SPFH domain-containing protein, partial [Patescibacteria group bacterium]